MILANVPKEAFTEAQHQLLASNCHDMGAGLIMLGGRDSFGAGGWMNTPVEKALPVDMQIKALKVQGIGAMVLIMHASEIAEGNYWQKVVAKAAINALSSYDYAGHAPLGGPGSVALHAPADRRGPQQHAPGDRPDDARRHARLRPVAPDGHEGAQRRQGRDDQAHRHHQRRRPHARRPAASSASSSPDKITVTAVLTAAHGNDPGAIGVMREPRPARPRGGSTTSPTRKALPRIYQKEARTISRPLIFEQQTPWTPGSTSPITEPVMGLPDELPPITGLVLTSPKENELVEIPIVSPLPTGQVNPLLAHWTLRPGPVGRVHLRRRPPVGQGLARLEELRGVLVAGRAVVDAARPSAGT